MENKTAAALSTYPGRSAVHLIRITGPDAFKITLSLFTPASGKALISPEPRRQYYGEIASGGKAIDRVTASFFKSPNSYTGEDTAEITCHGNPLIASMILRELYEKGCAAAEAGEFTKRAFLNGKMALSEAEAVADLISARSPAAASVALNALKGMEEKAIGNLRASLIEILSSLESDIDFAYEDTHKTPPSELLKSIQDVSDKISNLLKNCEAGLLIKEGVKISIAGRPNTGKSSLLNALLGSQRAIVADIPGTTRDTIEALSEISGVPVRFTDTAGIRATTDPVEAEGVRRAEAEHASSDIILLVADGSLPPDSGDAAIAESSKGGHLIAVINKSDLPPAFSDSQYCSLFKNPPACFRISAKTGEGISLLTEEIKKVIIGDMDTPLEAVMIASERHRQALLSALEAARDAASGLTAGYNPELAAVDVKKCAENLALITGRIASEDVLNDIFSKFCIGK